MFGPGGAADGRISPELIDLGTPPRLTAIKTEDSIETTGRWGVDGIIYNDHVDAFDTDLLGSPLPAEAVVVNSVSRPLVNSYHEVGDESAEVNVEDDDGEEENYSEGGDRGTCQISNVYSCGLDFHSAVSDVNSRDVSDLTNGGPEVQGSYPVDGGRANGSLVTGASAGNHAARKEVIKPRLDAEGDRIFWKLFLGKYRKYQCLWNPGSLHFKDDSQRSVAFNALIELCKTRFPDADKAYVVKRLRGFRQRFLHHLKKIRASGATGPLQSSLWYIDHLSFLLQVDPFRSLAMEMGISVDNEAQSLQNVEERDGDGDGSRLNSPNFYSPPSVPTPAPPPTPALLPTPAPPPTPALLPTPTPPPAPAAAVAFWTPTVLAEITQPPAPQQPAPQQPAPQQPATQQPATQQTSLQIYKRRRTEEDSQKIEDEFDISGRLIASHLRTLSHLAPQQTVHAQRLITSALFFARAGALGVESRVEPMPERMLPPQRAPFPPAGSWIYGPAPPVGMGRPMMACRYPTQLPLPRSYSPPCCPPPPYPQHFK